MKPYRYIKKCPICESNSTEFDFFIKVKDFTYSKEEFSIIKCKNCSFHFTNPIPEIDEIGNFYKSEDYVSHNSTQKGIINKIYNYVRKYTLSRKVSILKKYISFSNDTSILDFGSGTGHFLNQLKQENIQVKGIEPDSDARCFAKEHFNIDLNSNNDLENLSKEKYDVVTSWHVVEHIFNLNEDLKHLVSSIKNGGYYFIAVPNMNSYDARYYKENWAAYDVPRHLYHFKKSNIEMLMNKFGMQLVDTLPMKFDSFYVSMLSEKNIGGNILKAFFIGLLSNLKSNKYGYSSQIYVFKKIS